MNNQPIHKPRNLDFDAQEYDSITKKILTIIRCWNKKTQTRQQLKDFPDHLLDDIGINHETKMKKIKK